MSAKQDTGVLDDEFLKKILGNDDSKEYDEGNLILDIPPIKLKNTIKQVYSLDNLTYTSLKHILKEGAKFNQLLRIKDDCFDNMVDVLRLPLDGRMNIDSSVES